MAKLSQIGKALMMFASDNDDAFPTQEQLDNRGIDGYLGNPSLLNGFVYNGRTAMGDSPARTEAGYMLCPGGRAILFQDGHVVFVPDR
jgi:prepilin-type processing-associated H-X9-DG protein